MRRSGVAAPDSQVIPLFTSSAVVMVVVVARTREEGEESPSLFFLSFEKTSEPAGRVSPKFPKSAKSDAFEVACGAVVSLLCDAQAFPAPTFRSVE